MATVPPAEPPHQSTFPHSTPLRIALVVAALPLAFFVLSIAAFAVPNAPIAAHLHSALADGELSRANYPAGTSGIPVDKYSECIALTNGLGTTGHTSFLASAISEPDLGPCGSAAPLIQAWKKSAPHAEEEYYRYWQGYDVITRPLLALGGVTLTRYGVAFLLIVALCAWIGAVRRRAGWPTALALTVPVLLTIEIVDIAASIPHALSLAAAAGGAALIARGIRCDRPSTWIVFPLISGSVFAFVDLMTYPPLACVLTTSTAIVCARGMGAVTGGGTREAPPMRAMPIWKVGASAAVAWAAGYGFTWASKWLVDIVAFGFRAWRENIWSEITLRLGHGGTTSWDAIHLNFTWWRTAEGHWNIPIALACVVPVLLTVFLRRRSSAPRLALLAATGWPLVIPFLWYGTVRNQSAIQAFFTFRDIGATVAAATVACVVVLIEMRRVRPVPDACQPACGPADSGSPVEPPSAGVAAPDVSASASASGPAAVAPLSISE